jgi:hypothetical protein
MKVIPIRRRHDQPTKDLENGSTRNLQRSLGVPLSSRAPDSEEIRLRELEHQRKSLWKRFEDNPNEVHIATKLKFIDNQIAKLNQQYNHDANKIDNFEVAAVPEVSGPFLLLAVSHRRGS